MPTHDLNSLHAEYTAAPDADGTTASLHNAIRQYVTRMTRNHHLSDAEDAAGDVVAEVWRSLASFKGESSFSTWLHRLAKSSIIDRIRAERRRPNLISEDDEYRHAGTTSSHTIYMDVADLTALTESERQLVRQLILCPDYDALAEQLGISTVALRSRFARIKNKCEEQRCVSLSADD
jgi:RNA polymerase sigma factor (sigma-70 family)